MREWIAIICLGIIEGVTEFLPVSSTGHLLLAQHLDLGLPPQTDLFNAVIQCGAVMAVLLIFTERLKDLVFRWRQPEIQDYLVKLTTAFVITGVGGLILESLDFKLPETAAPVAWTLLVGGVLIIAIEVLLKGRARFDRVTWLMAAVVGLSQLVAIIFPGTSRAGITILAAMAVGVSRVVATEFSFLLGIPTLVSAGGLKIVSAMLNPAETPTNWLHVLVGSAVAAVTAFAVVRWLLRFVQTHTFIGFGWYRIGLGLLILLMVGS